MAMHSLVPRNAGRNCYVCKIHTELKDADIFVSITVCVIFVILKWLLYAVEPHSYLEYERLALSEYFSQL